MRKLIFVDMDGVLSDFEARYAKVFGRTPKEVREDRKKKEFSTHWHKFVDGGEFANLELFPSALKLVNKLNKLGTKIEIALLTSTGGFDRHNDVALQKKIWLSNHGIFWPLIAVPGRRFKKSFAEKNALLIDDTLDNVEKFREEGGESILYKSYEDAEPKLNDWLMNKGLL